jgi:RNA polymerase sigma-70 factor (ECF subfamily)
MNNQEIFSEYRNLLFSIAYNMLGIVEDAEDLVQDTYLKWSTVEDNKIKYPKAYLVKIITNLSINHLKSAKKIREDYIGLWLPEPLMKEKIVDASKSIDLYYSLSIGMMVLLEKLTPTERAVFLLKEVFSYEYTEISEIVEKEEENCRQIFARAKKHLGGKEKRFEVDIKVHSKMLLQFLDAVGKGNLNGLIDLLRDDIELIADGGGKSFSFGGQKFSATRRPLHGIRNVSTFVLSIAEKINANVPELSNKIIYANGLPSVVTYSGDQAICIICLEITENKISNIYLHTNPDKIKAIYH